MSDYTPEEFERAKDTQVVYIVTTVMAELRALRSLNGLLVADRNEWEAVARRLGWIWLADFYPASTIDDDPEWSDYMVAVRLEKAQEAVRHE